MPYRSAVSFQQSTGLAVRPIEDLYDIIREQYRTLSPEAQAKIRRAILSALVEEVTEGLITGHDARHDVLAAVRGAGAREPAPGLGLQVYGILARTSAVAASRLMMEAAAGPIDVVPYGALAALVGEAAYTAPPHHLLEWLASQGHAVLPLRPGLRCRNMHGVIDMLATQYEVLRQGLTELENQEEWVISIYCDRHDLLASVRASDKRVDSVVQALLGATPEPPRSDVSFFSLHEWKDTALEITQPPADAVAEALVENCVHHAHRHLAGLAQDSIHHQAGVARDLVSSGAYTIPRASDALFRASLKTLSATYHRLGFSFHSIGPRIPTIFLRQRSAGLLS